MSEKNWLKSQLNRAKHEVHSWDEWKQDAMRREATAISMESETKPSSRTTISADEDSQRRSTSD